MPLDYAALPTTALLPAESAGQLTVQLELPDTLKPRVSRGQTVEQEAQRACGEAVQGTRWLRAAAMRPHGWHRHGCWRTAWQGTAQP